MNITGNTEYGCLFRRLAGGLFLVVSTVQATIPLPLWSLADTGTGAVWPVMSPLPAPDGLRTCCALGYDIQVRIPGMTTVLPFLRVDNIVSAETTGGHNYNDSLLPVLMNRMPTEYNGIVYTRRGGFVDTAHVRDTADMTVWIFTHLWPRLGESFTLTPGRNELAQRRLVFSAFIPPAPQTLRPGCRYVGTPGLATGGVA